MKSLKRWKLMPGIKIGFLLPILLLILLSLKVWSVISVQRSPIKPIDSKSALATFQAESANIDSKSALATIEVELADLGTQQAQSVTSTPIPQSLSSETGISTTNSFESPIPTLAPSFLVAPTPTLPPPPRNSFWWEFPTYLSPDQSLTYTKLWQLEFDLKSWKLQMTKSDLKNLIHLELEDCTIMPTVGHGLSPDYSSKQSHQQIGRKDFDITQISHNNQLESINYCTAVTDEYTCFGVHLGSQSQRCISEAEVVLSTLMVINRPMQ